MVLTHCCLSHAVAWTLQRIIFRCDSLSVIPHNQLAVGGTDVKRTEAKESWEQSAYPPQEVFFLPCVSHASCVCVRVVCCLRPTGRSAKVKEVGEWDELEAPFSCCPFWLPAASSLWEELCCWERCCHVASSDLDIPVLDQIRRCTVCPSLRLPTISLTP